MSNKPELVDCLKAFNRKERYWVIRNALGTQKQDIPLSCDFKSKLRDATGENIPNNAWWALDYHIDWLAGALIKYVVPDSAFSKFDNSANGNSSQSIVTGTQEDFDFIVAFEQTIILIEAKFATHWDKKQIDKKIKRLRTLWDLKVCEESLDAHLSKKNLRVHFLLAGPTMKEENRPKILTVEDNKSLIPPVLGLHSDENFSMIERIDGSEGKYKSFHITGWSPRKGAQRNSQQNYRECSLVWPIKDEKSR